ncbi:Hypothetical protein D9617_11g009150 [Elsinoe fawcettii]|nr:Hypothetical protein D9617_11g009150 [Elsinoe fawcettii]
MSQDLILEDSRMLLFDLDVAPLRNPDPQRSRHQIISLGKITRVNTEDLTKILLEIPKNVQTILRPTQAEAQNTTPAKGVIVGLWRPNRVERKNVRNAAVDKQPSWGEIIDDPYALRVVARMNSNDSSLYALTPQTQNGLPDAFSVSANEVYYLPEFRDDTCDTKTKPDGRQKVWLALIREFTKPTASQSGTPQYTEERPTKRRATSVAVSSAASTPSVRAASLSATQNSTPATYPHFRPANTAFDASYSAQQSLPPAFPTAHNKQPYTPFAQTQYQFVTPASVNHYQSQPTTTIAPQHLLQQPLTKAITPSTTPRPTLVAPRSPIPADKPTDRPASLPLGTAPLLSAQDDNDSYAIQRAILHKQMSERKSIIESLFRQQEMDGRLLQEVDKGEKRLIAGATRNGWQLVRKDWTSAVEGEFRRVDYAHVLGLGSVGGGGVGGGGGIGTAGQTSKNTEGRGSGGPEARVNTEVRIRLMGQEQGQRVQPQVQAQTSLVPAMPSQNTQRVAGPAQNIQAYTERGDGRGMIGPTGHETGRQTQGLGQNGQSQDGQGGQSQDGQTGQSQESVDDNEEAYGGSDRINEGEEVGSSQAS